MDSVSQALGGSHHLPRKGRGGDSVHEPEAFSMSWKSGRKHPSSFCIAQVGKGRRHTGAIIISPFPVVERLSSLSVAVCQTRVR